MAGIGRRLGKRRLRALLQFVAQRLLEIGIILKAELLHQPENCRAADLGAPGELRHRLQPGDGIAGEQGECRTTLRRGQPAEAGADARRHRMADNVLALVHPPPLPQQIGSISDVTGLTQSIQYGNFCYKSKNRGAVLADARHGNADPSGAWPQDGRAYTSRRVC
jgi:hypothetical protein